MNGEGDLRCFDVETRKQIRDYKGLNAWIWQIAHSPDGKTLVGSGENGRLQFWEAATGKPLRQIDTKGGAWGVKYTSGGKRLLSGAWDVGMRSWMANEHGAQISAGSIIFSSIAMPAGSTGIPLECACMIALGRSVVVAGAPQAIHTPFFGCGLSMPIAPSRTAPSHPTRPG